MNANFKKETETAKIPTRARTGDAGCDFYADESMVIPSGSSRIISTGISWSPDGFPMEIINAGWEDWFTVSLIIQSRSGLAFKRDIEASNAGVIDFAYRGIIKVKLYNHGTEKFHVEKGMKICQGVPELVPYFGDVETLSDEHRGDQGFGSSDSKE